MSEGHQGQSNKPLDLLSPRLREQTRCSDFNKPKRSHSLRLQMLVEGVGSWSTCRGSAANPARVKPWLVFANSCTSVVSLSVVDAGAALYSLSNMQAAVKHFFNGPPNSHSHTSLPWHSISSCADTAIFMITAWCKARKLSEHEWIPIYWAWPLQKMLFILARISLR